MVLQLSRGYHTSLGTLAPSVPALSDSGSDSGGRVCSAVIVDPKLECKPAFKNRRSVVAKQPPGHPSCFWGEMPHVGGSSRGDHGAESYSLLGVEQIEEFQHEMSPLGFTTLCSHLHRPNVDDGAVTRKGFKTQHLTISTHMHGPFTNQRLMTRTSCPSALQSVLPSTVHVFGMDLRPIGS